MFPITTFYFRHFLKFYVTVIMVHTQYKLNNQMSEQIPSILVTLTVFNTSVAIYSNDSTRTKNDIKKHTNIKKYKKT